MGINKIVLSPAVVQVTIGQEKQNPAVLVKRYTNDEYAGSEVIEYVNEEDLSTTLKENFPSAEIIDERDK